MKLRVSLGALLMVAAATGAAPPTPEPGSAPPVLGAPARVMVVEDDTLVDVAARERVPFDLLVRLNPDVKVWIPDPGTLLDLPTRYIPPTVGPGTGLLVNVPEMRLYDFRRTPPQAYAIAVGDPVDPTPVGFFVVGDRRIHPTWRVPASIRTEKPHLPPVVPPGPGNPLGSRWLGLSGTSYGIHGTNLAWSIGRMSTHGCIRLYEDEMAELYARTPSGTRVVIVYEPVKVGVLDGGVYLEVHPDLYGRIDSLEHRTRDLLEALGLSDAVDPGLVAAAVADVRGAPVRVGSLGAPLPTSYQTVKRGP